MRITNYSSTISLCNDITAITFVDIDSFSGRKVLLYQIFIMTFTSPSHSYDSFEGIGICQEQIPQQTPTSEETASAVVRRPEKGWSHDGRGLDQVT